MEMEIFFVKSENTSMPTHVYVCWLRKQFDI